MAEIIDARPPSVIGSEWHRRSPRGDEWDEIVVRGVFDGGEVGGMELAVSPRSFGPTITCTPESLTDAYTRAAAGDDRDVLAEISHRLNQLQAGA